MRIAQIVLTGASEYERKCQRVDRAALAASHEVLEVALEEIENVQADVAHVYAGRELPARSFTHFPLPYVSSADVPRSRWSFRHPVAPASVVSPIAASPLPEAVEDSYFNAPATPPRGNIVGTLRRAAIQPMVEQTLSRIHRFRDDVTWRAFDHFPDPGDLSGVDLWVDPAMDDHDFDGAVAEALVVGLPVVAARTKINALRLEQGRTGTLVPPGDPNEMTHAILAALFKPEVATGKLNAARQTVSKFRARQRLRALTQIYETIR